MRAVLLALVLPFVVPAMASAADADFKPAPSPGPYSSYRDSPAGAGGLRRHEVVTAVRDVTVYRLYDSRAPGNSKVTARLGRYWTDFATSSEKSARDKLAVCKGWNNLQKVVRCTLPKGTKVVKGPGQDAKCAGLPGANSTAWHPGGPQQIFIGDTSVMRGCKDADTGW